jgi:hypothetical protein
VDLWVDTNVSKEHAASLYRAEEGVAIVVQIKYLSNISFL